MIRMEFDVKSPILGFENVTRVKLEKIDDIFMKLTNANDIVPSFTLVNPFILREYSFEIPTAIQVLLEIKDDNSSKLLITNIMVLYKNIMNSTINFLAPLIFNFDNKTMAQVVLDGFKYTNYGVSESISKYIKDNARN